MPMRCSGSASLADKWQCAQPCASEPAPGKDRIRGSRIATLRATRLGREEEW
jgi:hypothetical protein